MSAEEEPLEDKEQEEPEDPSPSDEKVEEKTLADLPPSELKPQDERQLMKETGYKMQIAGDTWYPISKKWWDAWKKYTSFDVGDEDVPGGIENMHKRNIPKPDKIDNTDLQDTTNPNALKADITENLTHYWIHSSKWDLIYKWYGGGPCFPRKVYEKGSSYRKETYICQNPKLIKIIYCDNKTGDINDECKSVVKGYPKNYQLKQIAEDLESELDGDDEKEDEPYVHLWLPFKCAKQFYPIDKKVHVSMDDFKDEDDNRWVEVPDDYLKTQIDEMESENNPFKCQLNDIVCEVKQIDEKEDFWPRKKEKWNEFMPGDIIDVQDTQQSRWYESLIRKVIKTEEGTELIIHYIGWNIKWDEKVNANDENRCQPRHTHTKHPHRVKKHNSYGYGWSYGYSGHDKGKPEVKGVVGLRNIGNTCFMNSTLQSLAQAPWLTEYFLSNDYTHHINKDNPLGWKGRVATAWGQLLHDMFSNQYRVLAPRQFKDAIGEVAPRFTGYQQQDSQELLSFLLDGLHEDLNQIKQKPATEPVESNGRKDAIVAAEAWKTYLKRNQSKIVDLLQAQYKSTVVCPDCNKVSITFDPYMFLSVPLPTQKYKVVEYTWVSLDKIPTVYGQKINKFYDITGFKSMIAKKHNVDSSELFVCDVWKSKIHRELKKHDSVAEINRRSDDIFVYHVPKPKEDKIVLKKEEEKPKEEDDNSDERMNEGAGNEYKMVRSNYITCLIINQRTVEVTQNEYNYHNQRSEEEAIGFPLLVTFHIKQKISCKELREVVFNHIKPYLRKRGEKAPKRKNSNEESEEEEEVEVSEYKVDDKDLPFKIYVFWGFNNNKELKMDDNEEFDLDEHDLKFLVHWEDHRKYKYELYARKLRIRDKSAPAITSNNDDEDDDRYGKPIELDACFEAFTEEEKLGENDAWYCNKCKDFKRAKKKIDLWSVPDILIIHLKRFSYTRNYRDRINTLVKFPIENLDLSKWLVNKYERNNCKYDCFAVSNHLGGMGGGHYTAYAKNLYNKKWYHFDDSRTSPVNDVSSMVSSSAYVLYYARQNPRKKRQKASQVEIPNIKRAVSMENMDDLIEKVKIENDEEEPKKDEELLEKEIKNKDLMEKVEDKAKQKDE